MTVIHEPVADGTSDIQAPEGTLASRAFGSSVLTIIGFGGAQVMRLGSNLILTRLLSPEDFGLMALVTSFLIGLTMFSDMGLGPSILQSRRGDDPDFLDTAWTIKVMRGVILLSAAVALSWPLAVFYDTPQFVPIFSVAAISLLIAGFNPTRMDTAARHLIIRRLVLVELLSQAVTIGLVVLLAWWLQSVWALAFGNVVGALVLLGLAHILLPGRRNRFRMEPAARHELVSFGKWIFLSTICGFLLFQGDRIILGAVLSLSQLGIYNIGYFLGAVPLMLGGAIGGRLFIPMYRQHPPGRSREDALKMARARAATTAFLIFGAGILVLVGPWLIGILYDHRYETAGGLLVLIALLQLPQILVLSYDYAALAAGDTYGMFIAQGLRSLIYFILVGLGAWFGGLAGVLMGQGLSLALSYPISVWLARKHHAWDPRHDSVVIVVTLILVIVAFLLHSAEISTALVHI